MFLTSVIIRSLARGLDKRHLNSPSVILICNFLNLVKAIVLLERNGCFSK